MRIGDASRLERIVAVQLARYPRMEHADVYKLLYQGAMGCSHAVTDRRSAGASLRTEAEDLEEGPPEPVVDTISSDGRMTRVNIRPYLDAGGDIEMLLQAFMLTAELHAGSMELLDSSAEWAAKKSAGCFFPPHLKNLGDYLNDKRRSGYPAVHHSPVYRKLYRPCYRVISADHIEELLEFTGRG